MTACANCSASLEPQWRFCIRCGAPVDRVAARSAIPSAIRPEPEDEPIPLRRRIDVPLLLGVLLGIAGMVLIGYMIVTLSGRS